MINGATGAMAAVLIRPIAEHGNNYLFYIVLFCGILQMIGGFLRVGKFVRLIPATTMIGFVNGLAIVIGRSQLHSFKVSEYDPDEDTDRDEDSPPPPPPPPGEPEAGDWNPPDVIGFQVMIALITIFVIFLVPRITKLFPASLAAIGVATAIEWTIRSTSDFKTPTIGEVAPVQGEFPPFAWDNSKMFDIPALDGETFGIVFMPAFFCAMVGLIECVLTMEVVNDLTRTKNNHPDQQLVVLGFANIIASLFGTMGGGAMIGLSMVNCHSGAKGILRFSGIIAALTVMLVVLAASPLIKAVPTAALIGVMAMVVFHTFDWGSLPTVLLSFIPSSWRERIAQKLPSATRKIDRFDAFAIVLVTVLTQVFDLFVAVAAGVALSALLFSWKQGARLEVVMEQREHEEFISAPVLDSEGSSSEGESSSADVSLDLRESTDAVPFPVFVRGRKVQAAKVTRSQKIYHLDGPLFFGSAYSLLTLFDFENDPNEVILVCRDAAIFDFSGIDALNQVGQRYHQVGKNLHVRFAHAGSARLIEKAHDLATFFSYEAGELLAVDDADVKLRDPHQILASPLL